MSDMMGHVADEVRDACLEVLGKVVSFEDSRVISCRILHKINAIKQAEHQQRVIKLAGG